MKMFLLTNSHDYFGKYLANVIIDSVASLIGFALTIGSFSIEKDMFENFNLVRYEASSTGTGMCISLTEKDCVKIILQRRYN